MTAIIDTQLTNVATLFAPYVFKDPDPIFDQARANITGRTAQALIASGIAVDGYPAPTVHPRRPSPRGSCSRPQGCRHRTGLMAMIRHLPMRGPRSCSTRRGD